MELHEKQKLIEKAMELKNIYECDNLEALILAEKQLLSEKVNF
ncbi:MAG: hypothetical protein E7E88_15180 [Clostridium perfringens]|nr:hypothetical protein [Veillonella sp.]MDU2094778.1 hypothetical protein [Clostridium perfringens]MDU2102686.1 hypothetical protein [Veillonella sp.]